MQGKGGGFYVNGPKSQTSGLRPKNLGREIGGGEILLSVWVATKLKKKLKKRFKNQKAVEMQDRMKEKSFANSRKKKIERLNAGCVGGEKGAFMFQ